MPQFQPKYPIPAGTALPTPEEYALQPPFSPGGGATLQQVLTAGNDGGGLSIVDVPNVSSAGNAQLTGGPKGAGVAGGNASLLGGTGDGGAGAGALVRAQGGDAAGNPGAVVITTHGQSGAQGGSLTSDNSGGVEWSPGLTDASASTGTINQVPKANGDGTWDWGSSPAPASPLDGTANGSAHGGEVAYGNAASGTHGGDADIKGGDTAAAFGAVITAAGAPSNAGGDATMQGGQNNNGRIGGIITAAGGDAPGFSGQVRLQVRDSGGGLSGITLDGNHTDEFTFSAHTGLYLFLNLPTSDPGVSGALWNNSGVIHVSP